MPREGMFGRVDRQTPTAARERLMQFIDTARQQWVETEQLRIQQQHELAERERSEAILGAFQAKMRAAQSPEDLMPLRAAGLQIAARDPRLIPFVNEALKQASAQLKPPETPQQTLTGREREIEKILRENPGMTWSEALTEHTRRTNLPRQLTGEERMIENFQRIYNLDLEEATVRYHNARRAVEAEPDTIFRIDEHGQMVVEDTATPDRAMNEFLAVGQELASIQDRAVDRGRKVLGGSTFENRVASDTLHRVLEEEGLIPVGDRPRMQQLILRRNALIYYLVHNGMLPKESLEEIESPEVDPDLVNRQIERIREAQKTMTPEQRDEPLRQPEPVRRQGGF